MRKWGEGEVGRNSREMEAPVLRNLESGRKMGELPSHKVRWRTSMALSAFVQRSQVLIFSLFYFVINK